MALARSTRVRNWSSGKSWNHQAFWDWHWQKQQAEERGTWYEPRKAESVQYRWDNGDGFHIAQGRHLLYVEIIRRRELPGGIPGYDLKVVGGAESTRDEQTLTQQHDEAVSISRSIPFRSVEHRFPQEVKQLDPSIKHWLDQLPFGIPITDGFLIRQ